MREFVTLSSWQVKTPLDALLLSLLCVALVFSVLIIISLVMMLMNKVRALDVNPAHLPWLEDYNIKYTDDDMYKIFKIKDEEKDFIKKFLEND